MQLTLVICFFIIKDIENVIGGVVIGKVIGAKWPESSLHLVDEM